MFEMTEVKEEKRKLNLIFPQLSWSPFSYESRYHIWSLPQLSNRKWKDNLSQ